MKLLKGLLMFLGMVFIACLLGGLFLIQQIKPQSDSQNNSQPTTESVSQIDPNESVEIALTQTSVNKMIQKYIQTMGDNPSGLNLVWQDDKVTANLTVPFNGMNVPATVTTNPVVEEGTLRLDVENINLSGLPLPKNQAYQMMRDNLSLPQGFTYGANGQSIHVDLNVLLNIAEGIHIQADKIDAQSKLLYVLMTQSQ